VFKKSSNNIINHVILPRHDVMSCLLWYFHMSIQNYHLSGIIWTKDYLRPYSGANSYFNKMMWGTCTMHLFVKAGPCLWPMHAYSHLHVQWCHVTIVT